MEILKSRWESSEQWFISFRKKYLERNFLGRRAQSKLFQRLREFIMKSMWNGKKLNVLALKELKETIKISNIRDISQSLLLKSIHVYSLTINIKTTCVGNEAWDWRKNSAGILSSFYLLYDVHLKIRPFNHRAKSRNHQICIYMYLYVLCFNILGSSRIRRFLKVYSVFGRFIRQNDKSSENASTLLAALTNRKLITRTTKICRCSFHPYVWSVSRQRNV